MKVYIKSINDYPQMENDKYLRKLCNVENMTEKSCLRMHEKSQILSKSMLSSFAKSNNLSFKSLSINRFGKKQFGLFPKKHFNITHSGEYVVLVESDQEIGIDIEKIRYLDKSIFNMVLTDKEYNELEQQTNYWEYFYSIWAAKESYLKMLGIGLTYPLSKIQVDLSEMKIEDICCVWYPAHIVLFSVDDYILSVCTPKKCNAVQFIGKYYGIPVERK